MTLREEKNESVGLGVEGAGGLRHDRNAATSCGGRWPQLMLVSSARGW